MKFTFLLFQPQGSQRKLFEGSIKFFTLRVISTHDLCFNSPNKICKNMYQEK